LYGICTYVCVCYPDEMREERRRRRKSMIAAIRCCYVSNEQKSYVCTSSAVASIPFFLFFLFFLLALCSPRFSFYVLCYTFNRTKSKKQREKEKSRNNVSDGKVAQVSITTSSPSLLFYNKLAIGQKLFPFMYNFLFLFNKLFYIHKYLSRIY